MSNELIKVAFTANVSRVVDPAVIARIQKSIQEKANMRSGQRGGYKGGKNQQGKSGKKPTSATGYSGHSHAQPRQIEKKAQAGIQIRRPGFGTTLQDVLSANTLDYQRILARHCLNCNEELNNKDVFCSECGVKQSQAFLEQKLKEADKIYIDTCALMEPSIVIFFEKANPILRECKKEIIISVAVELELKKIAKSGKYDLEQENKAKNALDIIHSDKNEITIINEEDDKEIIPDQVFKYVFEKERHKHKMLLISQDSKLSKEIININNSEAVRGKKCVVCGINDEGDLYEFVSKSI
ncbi:MAG: hypothetical protein LBC85_12455 [Fibromonadaceae bacterium]|jgi:hypothetical protein|nr:hypothetical protein [Fibromonadaceae bacterium]